MKNIFLKSVFILAAGTGLLTSCVNDDDFDIPPVRDPFFSERFQAANNNTNLDFTGWTNFAEQGTWLWKEKTFYSSDPSSNNGFNTNGYAEFSAFNSGASSNIVWLVTPKIDASMHTNPRLVFKCAQHHLDVDAPENSLEVLYSTDYDGTNVLSATWTSLDGLNLPKKDELWYKFLKSDVAVPSNENLYIAFKFRGSGTNLSHDGAYQIDDVFVYNQN